jgi:hypothetical protein
MAHTPRRAHVRREGNLKWTYNPGHNRGDSVACHFLERKLGGRQQLRGGVSKTMGGQTAQGLYEITLREEFAKNELTGSITLLYYQDLDSDKSTVVACVKVYMYLLDIFYVTGGPSLPYCSYARCYLVWSGFLSRSVAKVVAITAAVAARPVVTCCDKARGC